MCRTEDYPPFESVHPDQLALLPDAQPAERVKCGFGACRFYATTTFVGRSGEHEPRCDHHANSKAIDAAAVLGYTMMGVAS